MTWSIGIDLGGTAMKCVAARESGEVLIQKTQATNDRSDSLRDWVRFIRQVITEFEMETGSEATGVGVCSPGLASRDQRCISHLPGKLDGLEGFDWTDALGRKSLVPVINDAHAALLGEAWVGAAQGKKDVVLLTLGTGVGGAITSGGRLLKGAIGRAGHLGHMSLDIDGPPSICGMPGAIEVLFGNCTVSERSQGRFSSTQDLVAAHLAGDPAASGIWNRSIRALGCAIGSYINIVDPEIVVLTGGITAAGDAILKPLEAVLDEVEWRPGGHAVPIVFGTLGEWAGALGATRTALNPKLPG